MLIEISELRSFARRLMAVCDEMMRMADLEEIRSCIDDYYAGLPDGVKDKEPGLFIARDWKVGEGKYMPAIVYICYAEKYVDGLDPWKDCGGDKIISLIEDRRNLILDYKEFYEDEYEGDKLFAAVFKRMYA
jgi:hypothetical protein